MPNIVREPPSAKQLHGVVSRFQRALRDSAKTGKPFGTQMVANERTERDALHAKTNPELFRDEDYELLGRIAIRCTRCGIIGLTDIQRMRGQVQIVQNILAGKVFKAPCPNCSVGKSVEMQPIDLTDTNRWKGSGFDQVRRMIGVPEAKP